MQKEASSADHRQLVTLDVKVSDLKTRGIVCSVHCGLFVISSVKMLTLRQVCLESVQQSLLNWSRRNKRKTAESRDHGTPNPFSMYPIHIRQDIMDSLLQVKADGRDILRAVEILLAAGLVRFDLSCLDDCKYGDVFRILDLMGQTGSSLREVTICGPWLYRKDTSDKIRTFLERVPNLRWLKLQQTSKEGKELEVVSKSCPFLRRIEILHPSLDLEEVKSLVNFMKSEEQSTGVRLNIRDSLHEIRLPSSVKGKAILLLLEAFPNLESVRCACLDEVLHELEESIGFSDSSLSCQWKKRLTRLLGVQATHPLGDTGVSRFVNWCHNVQEVSLEVQEGMNLHLLSQLPCLQTLELRNSPTLPASYRQEVLPLLNAVGKQLYRLSLEQFDVVDLDAAVISCPNLRSLSVQWFVLLSTKPLPAKFLRNSSPPLRHLRVLRLRPQVNRQLPAEPCSIILPLCPELSHLELYNSMAFNDNLVNHITLKNALSSLRILILRHGHGLTVTGLGHLVSSARGLKFCDVGQLASGVVVVM